MTGQLIGRAVMHSFDSYGLLYGDVIDPDFIFIVVPTYVLVYLGALTADLAMAKEDLPAEPLPSTAPAPTPTATPARAQGTMQVGPSLALERNGAVVGVMGRF